MKGRQGFTLMELLVVLLIIGILSTVALRTIDATRDRSLFDQTTKEMNQLVQAIVGNPDLTYDGRRVDFGYYGDMEELPTALRDLVYSPGNAAWRGPYLKLMSAGDTVSYLYDGWGLPYTYNPTFGLITSNGKFSMTVKIADSLPQLTDNTISGTLIDRDGNQPDSITASRCTVRLYYNNEALHSTPRVKVPYPGGCYQFSPAGADIVPIGIHKLVAKVPGESLVRWVTVSPRSHTIVDFKFTSPFWNKLKMVGPARVDGSGTGFLIQIANEGTENVAINSLKFLSTSALVYMRSYKIDTQPIYNLAPSDLGIGPGDSINFPQVTIAPNLSQRVDLLLADFRVGPQDSDPTVQVSSRAFGLRFSDGSEIRFTVP